MATDDPKLHRLTKRKGFCHLADNRQSALKTPRRWNPFAQYVFSLAAAIAAYSVYAIFAVPLLEGPPNEIQARRSTASIAAEPRQRDKSWLKPFVPADGWELESCKTVAVEGGTILFRDYQPMDDGYAEVFPFTLILNAKPPRSRGTHSSDGKPDETPISVRCAKRARLKFDRPLAESVSGGGLKLEAARLVGEVTIYRPPSAVGESDGVSVVTSNVQIEPKQIFTLDQVQFAFGNNTGIGRHLRIDLDRTRKPTANPLTSVGFSGVTGVNRIELASLQQLRLEPTESFAAHPDKAFDTASAPRQDSDLFSNGKSPLQVSCAGPFAFDFKTKTATFNQRVRVEQLDQDHDRLNCDQLTLTFDGESSAQQSSAQSGMTLKTFLAKGLPAEVVAHSRNTKITGDQLFYDVSERQFDATSAHQVTVETPDFQLLSRQLSYVVPVDRSMGPVDARGPGRMLRPGSVSQEPMLVTWQQGLTVRPDGTQQHVAIDGQSVVHLGHDTSLVAQQIELWLVRSEVTDKTKPASHAGEQKSEPDDWKPNRLLATGQVKIKTQELTGTANQLTATWQGTDPSEIQRQSPDGNSNAGFFLSEPLESKRHKVARVIQDSWTSEPPVTRVAMQRIEQPRNAQTIPLVNSAKHSDIRTAPNKNPTSDRIVPTGNSTGRKIDFHGDDVLVELTRVGLETEIADLKINGNVRVNQTSLDEQVTKTNSITGTRLHLVPQANDQQRIQISGHDDQLATFRSEELNLDGQEIFVDQDVNRIWVEGRGKLSLNGTPASDQGNQNSSFGDSGFRQPEILEPEKRASIRQLEVDWAAGMIFDGRKIYFERDVAMTAESAPDQNALITRTRSFSQGLSITLTNEVRFNSTENNETKLDEIVLVDRIAAGKRVFQLANKSDTDPDFQLAGTSTSTDARPGSSTNRLTTPIVIEHQTLGPDKQITERQTVIASNASYSATTGMVRAAGPGSIQLHQRGKPKTFTKTDDATSSGSRDSNSITLTHVKFDDRLIADSNKKQMEIHGQVRSLTSPVRSFDEVFDPDREIRTWPVDAVKLVCEHAQLAQWDPQAADKPSSELIATGNAHITSSKFEATADRVSYSQLNDMLVVEGTPRSDANLWFRRNPAARPDHLVAGKILYRLSDQWTEVQNVRNVKIKSK